MNFKYKKAIMGPPVLY
jgi:hypothetical protein